MEGLLVLAGFLVGGAVGGASSSSSSWSPAISCSSSRRELSSSPSLPPSSSSSLCGHQRYTDTHTHTHTHTCMHTCTHTHKHTSSSPTPSRPAIIASMSFIDMTFGPLGAFPFPLAGDFPCKARSSASRASSDSSAPVITTVGSPDTSCELHIVMVDCVDMG